MKRTFALSTALLIALSACGGEGTDMDTATETPAEAPTQGVSGDEVQAAGPINADWYSYSEADNTVQLDLVSGQTPDNNYWNYNGFTSGEVTVRVPVGAQVTVSLTNQDPNMAHSVGVDATTSGFSASPAADPAFANAITPNPTSMTEATQTGETDTFTFTADQAGSYSLLCYVPGHGVAGMWILFEVAAEGPYGVVRN